jgi:hypothetical protein
MKFVRLLHPLLPTSRCPQKQHQFTTANHSDSPNASGWWILLHWLRNNGEENCKLVKDITVWHPRGDRFPQVHLTSAHELLYNPHLRPFQMPTLPEYGGGQYENSWNLGQVDPIFIPRRMPSLCNLRLINSYPPRYGRLVEHDIYKEPLRQNPNLKITILSLLPVSRVRERGWFNAADVTSLTNERLLDERLLRPWEVDDPQKNWYIVEKGHIQALKEVGVDIVDCYFHEHRHYPVQPNKPCANESLCQYLKKKLPVWKEREESENLPCRGT